jgi:hypothetical protein
MRSGEQKLYALSSTLHAATGDRREERETNSRE